MSVSISRTKPLPPADTRERKGVSPPLESGDRLTRHEFERRYDAMPHLKKAELIEGVVYVPSPVRQKDHGKPHSALGGWLFVYQARTPGLETGDNSTVRLDLNNEPQPDCLLFIQAEHGGRVQIDEDGYVNGAPNWSPRLPPAAPATTCTTSSRRTGETACANTSSGASTIGKSTGSCCARSNTKGFRPATMEFCAVRSLRACGSTRRARE